MLTILKGLFKKKLAKTLLLAVLSIVIESVGPKKRS